MTTINGNEVNQVIFNGQETTVIVVNNQTQWVKPNYEQTFSVYGTTGNVQQSTPSGLRQYFTYQELYVGTEIIQATINGDNSISLNKSTGKIGYTLYSHKSNQNVNARITLTKYKTDSTTLTLTTGSIYDSFGKYPINGSRNIGTGWTNVSVNTPFGCSNVKVTYNSNTGEARVSGYANKANSSYKFILNYNNG